jgi:hypothetical protein
MMSTSSLELLLTYPESCRLLRLSTGFILGYYPTPAFGCWQLTEVGSCRIPPEIPENNGLIKELMKSCLAARTNLQARRASARSLPDNPVLRDIRTSLYSTGRATFSWGKAKAT